MRDMVEEEEQHALDEARATTAVLPPPRATVSYGGRGARRAQEQRQQQQRIAIALAESNDPGTEATPSTRIGHDIERGTEPSSSSSTVAKPKSLGTSGRKSEQMILDLGQRIRTACKGCGMSFDRSDAEDTALHKKMHDEVVLGVEWSAKLERSGQVEDVGKPVKVGAKLREDMKRLEGKPSSDNGQVRILICRQEARGASTALQKKLVEIERRVDESLGAITKESGSKRTMVLAVWQSRRVVGAAVVGQTKLGMARRLVSSSQEAVASITSFNNSSPSSGGGAMFVSDPLPEDKTPPLAIHRIFVLPLFRRTGLGTALLDAALETAIYGLSAAEVEASCGGRANTTSFSQPTELGQKLALSWINHGLHGDKQAPVLVFDDDDDECDA